MKAKCREQRNQILWRDKKDAVISKRKGTTRSVLNNFNEMKELILEKEITLNRQLFKAIFVIYYDFNHISPPTRHLKANLFCLNYFQDMLRWDEEEIVTHDN